MRRIAGIVALLLGAILVVAAAAFLYLTYAALFAGGHWFVAFLSAAAFIALAGFTLRRAARILALSRLAFSATALLAVAVVALSAAAGSLAVSEWSPRARQKRTMADLRKIAAALEARAEESNSYPPGDDFHALRQHLTPRYIAALPERDHWGHPLRYEWQRTGSGADGYANGSAGRDGRWQHARLGDYTTATTTNFDDDIVLANGTFIQLPAYEWRD